MSEFQIQLKRKSVPDAELLADLRRVAALVGAEVLSRTVYNTHGRFSDATLRKRFGGWPQAQEAASLKSRRRYPVSDAALFENLAAVWRALGRQPVLDDLHRARGLSRFDPSTYPRRFGSWNAALLRFPAYQDGSDWRSSAKGNTWAPRDPVLLQAPTPDPSPQIVASGSGEPTPASPRHRTRRTPGWRLRARVLMRDRSTCQLCGASPGTPPGTVLHVDHIVPWSKGGETVEANLRTLCAVCNVGKGDS